MPSLDEISIALEGIGHALSDNMLAVPVYQRSYAWEERHVLDLIQDIATAMHEQEKEYFVGSIVISEHSSERPEVVDGQQRLATTSILIAAIRDWFYSEGDKDRADDIERKFLVTRELRTQERVARLHMNDNDHDFFLKRILSTPDSEERSGSATKESHIKMVKAADLARNHVLSIVQLSSKPAQMLLDWIDYLTSNVRVIWVGVPDHANAFTIFETLNDRGLDLAISDLLKNYLFHLADDRISEVQQRWVSMFGAMEAIDNEKVVVDYIRYLWSSKHGVTREKDLYDRIKEQITSKQAAIDFADELAESAKLYSAILSTDNDFWNEYGPTARFHMATINLLRMVQIRPLLLAILAKFPVREVQKVLRAMVAWSVRFLIYGGLGGGTLERHYSDRATEVRSGKIATAEDLQKAMSQVVPTDQQFEQAFATATVSKVYLARYYLRALESMDQGDPEPAFVPNPNQEVVTLEHILPENASSAWSRIDEETAKVYYRRIGNLALLKSRMNLQVGNDGFRDKKPVLARCEFALTSSIAECEDWGPKQIESRQRELAVLAVRTWPNKV